jgi:hypothetical protein
MPEKPFALTQNTPAQPQAEDYDAIHSAVMETSRGNWFLTEFARRNRNADTALVLAAIKRIESAMRNQTAIPAQSHAPDQAAPAQDQPSAALGHQLHELRDAIALTKESLPEIAADGRIALRNADFSRIAAGIERVAARMRASAEQAAQTAQTLRERAHKEFGIEKDALDRRAGELDAQAQDLSTFCVQLDEQIESARMVATLLAEIEAQLDGMIARQKTAPPEPRVINPVPPIKPVDAPAPEPPAAAAAPPPVQPVATHTPPPAPAAEPVTGSAPPPPQAEAAVIAPSPATPEVAQAAEPVAIQPEPAVIHPEPAAIEPAPEAVAPPDNKWMENLAPPVHARNAPVAPANFDLAEETRPAAVLPNPAAREAEDGAPAPAQREAVAQPAVPPRSAEPHVADTPMDPRIKVMPQATVPATPEPVRAPKPESALPPRSATSDDPTDFLFEPLPQTAEPQPATNGAAHAKPAAPATRPADPLAPIMALSDEEKIALFS